MKHPRRAVSSLLTLLAPGGVVGPATAALATAVLPADRDKFFNVMPPCGAVYPDADSARVVSFLRQNFAKNAPAITAIPVAAQRGK